MENATSAASRFGRTAIVLRSLGVQVRSLKTLYNLCLTSKLFYCEFSIHLYRELDTCIDMIDESNPHLVHTRTLLVRGTWSLGDDEFDEVVQRLVTKMPRLESFEWPPTRALSSATVKALKSSCSQLQAIHVHYINQDEEKDVTLEDIVTGRVGWGYFYRHNLSVFKNLQYLSLTHLNDDLHQWGHQIVEILLNSPTLKGLDISISAIGLYRHRPGNTFLQDENENFFENLCDDYEEAGGQPLHLRSLRCGQAIYPTSRWWLAKLTDPEFLEEIDICNLGVQLRYTDLTMLYSNDHFHYADFDECHIDLHAFTPTHCPNLRYFSAAEYQDDVHSFLGAISEHKPFTRRLIVRFERLRVYDTARMLRPDPDHPGLPIQLRMFLGLQLDRFDPERYRDESEKFSVEQILDDLVSSTADSLEGLLVNVAEGKRVTRSTARALFDFQGLDAVESALPRLPRLTQLAVNTDRIDEDGEGFVLPGRVLRAAKRLALAGPSLVYVNIYKQFWHILRTKKGTVQLVEMEEREWKDVELFYHVVWKPSRYSWNGGV